MRNMQQTYPFDLFLCLKTKTINKQGERELDLEGESSDWQSPIKKPRHDTRLGSYTGIFIVYIFLNNYNLLMAYMKFLLV